MELEEKMELGEEIYILDDQGFFIPNVEDIPLVVRLCAGKKDRNKPCLCGSVFFK